MKTNIRNSVALCTAAAVVIAIAVWLPARLGAADEPMHGGQRMLHLQELKTKKQLDALKTGDTIAMACAKCKTIWITRVKEDAHGAQILNAGGKPVELVGTHGCAGCKDTITVVGQGKGAVTELKHTCNACGGDLFCCSTKPGEATKGMEKKTEKK